MGAVVRKGTRTGIYRSKFEADVAASLTEGTGLYEAVRLPYVIMKHSHYIPDWVLPKQCIVMEAKGYFPSADRTKMLLLKEQYPTLDIRLLFQKDGKLSKTSRTTYVMWATKHGFICAVGSVVPDTWINHKPTRTQKKAFTEAVRLQEFSVCPQHRTLHV